MKRFELVNIRHDEGYETLGNWVSHVTFSVLEHKDGWGSPKFVHTEQWVATFSDDDDPTWSKVVSEKEVSRP